MAKILVLATFIGSALEVEKYGGQLPPEFKKMEKKMSQGEKDSFAGKITAGTEMEVSNKRANQLASLGLAKIVKLDEKDEEDDGKEDADKKGSTVKVTNKK